MAVAAAGCRTAVLWPISCAAAVRLCWSGMVAPAATELIWLHVAIVTKADEEALP